jgi:hypothetical protein
MRQPGDIGTNENLDLNNKIPAVLQHGFTGVTLIWSLHWAVLIVILEDSISSTFLKLFTLCILNQYFCLMHQLNALMFDIIITLL